MVIGKREEESGDRRGEEKYKEREEAAWWNMCNV